MTVNKYAGAFLQAFTFRSQRRHEPLLAAIAPLKRIYAEKRRTFPDSVRKPTSAKLIGNSSSNKENLIAVSTRSQRFGLARYKTTTTSKTSSTMHPAAR